MIFEAGTFRLNHFEKASVESFKPKLEHSEKINDFDDAFDSNAGEFNNFNTLINN